MNPILLLIPVAIHALVTLAIYAPMSMVRLRTIREGKVKARVYKLNRDEPEESLRWSNAIRNQNETGGLFYAACIIAYVTNGGSFLTALLAWGFLIVKLAHVAVHVSSNDLRLRRPLFMGAYVLLILLWLVVLLHLVSGL